MSAEDMGGGGPGIGVADEPMPDFGGGAPGDDEMPTGLHFGDNPGGTGDDLPLLSPVSLPETGGEANQPNVGEQFAQGPAPNFDAALGGTTQESLSMQLPTAPQSGAADGWASTPGATMDLGSVPSMTAAPEPSLPPISAPSDQGAMPSTAPPMEPAAMPSTAPVEPANIPSMAPLESGGPTTMPPLDPNGSSTMPPLDSSGPSTMAPLDLSGPKTLPPMDSGAPFALPKMDSSSTGGTIPPMADGAGLNALDALGSSSGPVNEEEEHLQKVFRDFVAIKRQCGENTDNITADRFIAKLRKNRESLIKRYSCRSVKFQVYVKDGKAAVKATPVKE